MIKKIKILSLILLTAGYSCYGQTLTPVLVGSTGDFSVNVPANISLSYSVGEPAVETYSGGSFFLTQGFQQPNFSVAVALTAVLTKYDVSCPSAKDGSANIFIISGTPPYAFTWSHDSTITGSSASNLAQGTYYVSVKDANNYTFNDSVSIIPGTGICGIHIYTGITPNGDGANDTWVIDNIDLYPENSVSIYNRWGQKVWSGIGYDNMNVVWKGENMSGDFLPDATYFYIVTTLNQKSTGWVELTR